MSVIAKLTIGQYDRMIAAGIFDQSRRVELIHGELREMTPIGPVHESIVDYLTRWSTNNTSEQEVRIRIQNSIGIPDLDSAPEPDVVWVKERSYAKGRPTRPDVLLIIEVADSSVDYDRNEKADLYAAAGIKDYWVVNAPHRQIEVFREPENGRCQTRQNVRVAETICPLSQADAVLDVSRLFST